MKEIEKIKEEVWDDEFLKLVNKYCMKINEHNLIIAISTFGETCYYKGKEDAIQEEKE